MTNKYLTKKRKEYYMIDFQNLLKFERDFWEVDNMDLKQILIDINQSPNIQTLYSKYSNKSNPNNNTSYLEFTYTSKIELTLFREIIPHFINYYNLNSTYYQSTCNYDFSLPKENNNFELDSPKFGINCTDDKDYFKINHLRIKLNSNMSKVHDDFWKDLKSKLTEL